MEDASDNNEDDDIANTTEISKPYLPSWVLRMREKIDASRAVHADAELRISSLQSDVANLSIKLEKMLPNKMLPLAQTTTTFISSTDSKTQSGFSSNIKFVDLPLDTLIIICEFLTFSQLFLIRASCHQLKKQIESSLPSRLLRVNCRFHFLWKQPKPRQQAFPATTTAAVTKIIDYAYKASQSKNFLRMMKEQRSIPKFRQVQPRRYSRSERSITHPLPLFDQGETMSNNQMVMSHAESLDGDFRSFAHRALEAMVLLTACLYDRFANDALDLGVVTVMVSLLSNEEAMIKSYASEVLANLLCWEATTRRKGSAAIDGKSTTMPLQDQILACSGQRQLPTLLTSPSATINLVASQSSKESASSVDNSGKSNIAKISSRVQGVCNKNASRALIVLFYPDYPVHSRKLLAAGGDEVIGGGDKFGGSSKKCSFSPSSSKRVLPSIFPQLASLSPIRQNIFNMEDRNSSGKAEFAALVDASSVLPQQLQWSQRWLCDLVSNVMQEEISRPWQFTYFYKSGAFKDQFVTHLCFDKIGGIEGGGTDNIGSFCIDGESQVDMTGRTMFFHKTYLNGLQYAPDMSLLDYLPYKKGSAHVSHVGYWSDGIIAEGSSSDIEPWSSGIWGVWETCSNQSHYELQKGGVFRAIPVESLHI